MSSGFRKFQNILLSILIAVSFFYGGYYFGQRGFNISLKTDYPYAEVTNKYPSNENIDFSLFWEVWERVSEDYLMRPVDQQKMMYGAIKGMVDSLGDPYTSYLPPAINKNVSDAINGLYQGIGAELGVKENQLMVVAPLDGSPAKANGLMSGDKILEIEGESTLGVSLTEAVSKIRGPAGTVSTLTVQRGDNEPVIKKITRDVITVASVTWEDKGDGTAYIRVSRFGGDTNEQWAKAVSEINVKMRELDAVVVDVRGNPGGYLQSAVYIAGEFFRGKPVLYQEDAKGEQNALNAERLGSFDKLPGVFVLIDEGSASASEILAAALRSQIKAQLIGVKSFGKGTIQDARDFKDGSGVHITIAKWLTPDKEWIHQKGLEPDVVVENTTEDLEKNTDSQLNKALELAKAY